jgi:hypothetical protein
MCEQLVRWYCTTDVGSVSSTSRSGNCIAWTGTRDHRRNPWCKYSKVSCPFQLCCKPCFPKILPLNIQIGGWMRCTSLKEIKEKNDLIISQISLLLLLKHNSHISSLGSSCLHFVLLASSIDVNSHELSKEIEQLFKTNHCNSTRVVLPPSLLWISQKLCK